MAPQIRIKSDDTVIVIAGKDKGKTGKVLRVDARNEKVFVEGLNMVKRHQRPVPGRPNAAGRRDREGGRHPRLQRGALRREGQKSPPAWA